MLQSRNKTKYRIIGLFAALFLLAPMMAGAGTDVIKNGDFEDDIPLKDWTPSNVGIIGTVGSQQANFNGNGSLKQTITLPEAGYAESLSFYAEVENASLAVILESPGSGVISENYITSYNGGVSDTINAEIKSGATLQFIVTDFSTGSVVTIDDVSLLVGELPTETETPTETYTPTPTPTVDGDKTPSPEPTATEESTPTPTESQTETPGTPTPADTGTPTSTNTPMRTPTPQNVTQLQVSANPNYLSASADDLQKGKAVSRIQMKAIHPNGSVERKATASDFSVEVSGPGLIESIEESTTLDGVVYAEFVAAAKGRAVITVTYSNSQTTGSEPISASVGILIDVVETKSGSSIAPKKKSVLYQRWK